MDDKEKEIKKEEVESVEMIPEEEILDLGVELPEEEITEEEA